MLELLKLPARSAAQTITRPARYHARAVSFSALSTKKNLLLALVASAFASLLLPAFAGAVAIEPKSGGSPNADSIVDLYRIVGIIGVVVLLLVEGALLASVLNRGGERGSDAAAPSEGANTQIIWTGVATALVVVLAAATFVELPGITTPPNGLAPGVTAQTSRLASLVDVPTPANGKKLQINVTGRQFIWRYTYGENLDSPFVYTEMVVPSDTVIVLNLQSSDVIHSWWIPALGGKFDAVPGTTNYAWFKAPTPKNPRGDLYTGQCAEFCGNQHAAMTASVRVVTPAQFTIWLATQKQRIADANKKSVLLRTQLANEGQIPDLTPPVN